MPLIGISPEETQEYISKHDKSESPTIFHIGVLTNEDRINLMTKLTSTDGQLDMSSINSECFDIFKKGVKKVSNFQQSKKAEALVYANEEMEIVVQSLPVSIIIEVAVQVVNYNYLTVEEEKN